MKRVPLIVTCLSFPSALLAVQPPDRVPDSGSSIGMIVLGLLAVLAIRRKLSK